MKSLILLLSLFLLVATLTGQAQKRPMAKQNKPITNLKANTNKYKITFVELGSVRCIPCQKMQAVMKSIEKKYAKQVNVVFHDVWTPEGKPFGEQYAIQVIPTQIFLNDKGKEFFRHEGFFPEDELIKILNKNGVR